MSTENLPGFGSTEMLSLEAQENLRKELELQRILQQVEEENTRRTKEMKRQKKQEKKKKEREERRVWREEKSKGSSRFSFMAVAKRK